MGKYEDLAKEVGQLVDEKNKQYGNSFDQAGEFLKLLYPNGLQPEQYGDMLALVRMFDKMKRIATNKDAFSEEPYKDLVGYGLLGLNRENERKQLIPPSPVSQFWKAQEKRFDDVQEAHKTPLTERRKTK